MNVLVDAINPSADGISLETPRLFQSSWTIELIDGNEGYHNPLPVLVVR